MPDFSTRSGGVEIMDDLECSGNVLEQTLLELELINKWLGGNQITIDAIARLCRMAPGRQLTIADLGCGGGDMLRTIEAWGKKNNVDLKLIGLDANPNVIAFARKNIADRPHILFETVNIFSNDFLHREYDIVVGTLFFHHFTDHQLVSFFRQLKGRVKLGYIINDIHRHWLAYYSIKILTWLFSRSAMVKYDAPLSVLRAFRKMELIKILEQASPAEFAIRWRWAFRWQVIAKVAMHAYLPYFVWHNFSYFSQQIVSCL
jgi:2-polyprenyl-3-methyl-5-hydroxy-6-metoxy-1,4-benzoquinol methylase